MRMAAKAKVPAMAWAAGVCRKIRVWADVAFPWDVVFSVMGITVVVLEGAVVVGMAAVSWVLDTPSTTAAVVFPSLIWKDNNIDNADDDSGNKTIRMMTKIIKW